MFLYCSVLLSVVAGKPCLLLHQNFAAIPAV